jgi:hypothetical protein
MRTKLTLHVESLSVESFETTATHQEKGTVFGEECSCQTICSCPGCPTCAYSCADSCEGSCDASCTSPETKCDTCLYTCGTNSYCADCTG